MTVQWSLNDAADTDAGFVCSFHPGQSEWIYNPGDAICTVACSEKSTGKIFVYDGRGSSEPLHVFDKLHSSPLTQIRLNPKFRVIVSADKAGMLEYWTGLPNEFKFPKHVQWEYKTDTDLYEFAKNKTYPTSLAFSPDGKRMATIASDRKVRIFRFLTGKLARVFDESLTVRWPSSSSSSSSVWCWSSLIAPASHVRCSQSCSKCGSSCLTWSLGGGWPWRESWRRWTESGWQTSSLTRPATSFCTGPCSASKSSMWRPTGTSGEHGRPQSLRNCCILGWFHFNYWGDVEAFKELYFCLIIGRKKA